MENEKWIMKNEKILIINYQFSIIHYPFIAQQYHSSSSKNWWKHATASMPRRYMSSGIFSLGE